MSLSKRIFCNTAAALALAAAAFSASPAYALSDKARLKSISFNVESHLGTIRVISTDGQKWDKLKSGAVALNADYSVNTKWPGYVEDVGIRLGSCSGSSCWSFPSLWYKDVEQRDTSGSAITGFQTALLPISSPTGIALNPAADAILSRCNEKLQADGPTKSHSFTQQMFATLTVGTDESLSMNFVHNIPEEVGSGGHSAIDYTESDAFTVEVICEPVIKSPVADLKHDLGEFDIENVKLFLTTYQNTQPGSNPGTVCPALKVTSRAETSKAGPVAMRIWRQKNGGPITSTFHEAWASYDPAKNGYFATYEKFENVGTTSYFQFKTEIVDGSDPFAPFDGWKDITVHCTSPGGGGFADQPKPDNDMPKPQAKWDGEITVSDSAGRDKSCPRKGQVSFNVSRQAPGQFDYRISCSNGAYFEGSATGFADGNGGFAAYGIHEISVNRTRSIQCTLQEMTPAPVTVDVDKEDFTCANPNFDPPSNDLTGSTKPLPTSPEPQKPIVAACEKNEKLVRGKCIGVSIHCLPGFVQDGLKCVRKPVIVQACKTNQIRIDGKCVKKPEVSILCKPGFELKGKTCVRKPTVSQGCPLGQKLVRGNCVGKPKPAIVNTLTKKPVLTAPKPKLPKLKAARMQQQKAILPFKGKKAAKRVIR